LERIGGPLQQPPFHDRHRDGDLDPTVIRDGVDDERQSVHIGRSHVPDGAGEHRLLAVGQHGVVDLDPTAPRHELAVGDAAKQGPVQRDRTTIGPEQVVPLNLLR